MQLAVAGDFPYYNVCKNSLTKNRVRDGILSFKATRYMVIIYMCDMFIM